MDLTLTPDEVAFRDEVRAWLAANVPAEPLPSMDTADGFAAHMVWERRLAAAGLSAVSWPRALGGRDATLIEWLLFEEQYYASGAPGRANQNGLSLLGPTLMNHGTDAQRERFLPPMARGEQTWAQAWSEPEAGSDLAGLKATAERVEGGWRLSGQKTWSSRGAFADWAFGPFRSEPGSERHRGLTYFVFPLDIEGVEVRPVGRLDGQPGFAEIFLDDAFVPDDCVIGEPGRGWQVAMSTTGSERGLSLRSPGRFLAASERLRDLWSRTGDPDDTALRDRVVDAWIDTRAYALYTYGTVARIESGATVGAESSMNKVFWSELDVALHETALDVAGTRGELLDGPESIDDGRWMDGYLFSLSGPIYAGTNEIQRNVIAERVLGLPRGSR